MNPSFPRPNHERWFQPGFQPCARKQIARCHHGEQSEQRWFGFAQRHRSPADNPQARRRRRGFHASPLRGGHHREDACEKSASLQTRGRSCAVIGDIAARLKPAGDFLRMIPFHAAPQWKIGRAAEDQIEFFLRTESRFIPKIALTDFVALFQPIPTCRFAGKAHAFRLRFNCDKPRPGQPPGGDHSHGADSASQIKNVLRRRATHRAVPSGQDVIGRKAMTFGQLEQPKIAADRVKRLARINGGTLTKGAGRYGSRLGPSLKQRFCEIVAQASKIDPSAAESNPILALH